MHIEPALAAFGGLTFAGFRERAVEELGEVGIGRSRLGPAPSALALDVCGPGHAGFHACHLRRLDVHGFPQETRGGSACLPKLLCLTSLGLNVIKFIYFIFDFLV